VGALDAAYTCMWLLQEDRCSAGKRLQQAQLINFLYQKKAHQFFIISYNESSSNFII
jgi:hypothetical protein